VALGIVHRPEVIFLGEPGTGHDPQARAHLWDHVRASRVVALARLREALDGLEELFALLPGNLSISRSERASNTVGDVVIEDFERHCLERGRDRRHLGEDVYAVAVLGNHPFDPANLALYPAHPPCERAFVPCRHIAMDWQRHLAGSARSSGGAHSNPRGRGRKWRRRSEFDKTKKLENAMAAAPTIGLITPATARGMTATL